MFALSVTESERETRGAGKRRCLKFLKTMETSEVRCEERRWGRRTIRHKRGGIWCLSKQVAALSLPQAIRRPFQSIFCLVSDERLTQTDKERQSRRWNKQQRRRPIDQLVNDPFVLCSFMHFYSWVSTIKRSPLSVCISLRWLKKLNGKFVFNLLSHLDPLHTELLVILAVNVQPAKGNSIEFSNKSCIWMIAYFKTDKL